MKNCTVIIPIHELNEDVINLLPNALESVIKQTEVEIPNILVVVKKETELLEKINAGLKTLNTVLYLAMAGVPIKTLHYFMNQPLILEYIENLSIYESQVFQINNERIYSDDILQLTTEAFLKSKGITEVYTYFS